MRGHKARFVRKLSKNGAAASRKRSGKRLAAYRRAKTRGLGARAAARSAVRAVPFTKGERRVGRSFKGVKQRYRRNDDTGSMFKTQVGLGPTPQKTRMSKTERRRAAAAKRKARAALQREKRVARVQARKAKRSAVVTRKRERRAAASARKKAKWAAGAERRARTAARKAHGRRVKSVQRKYRRVKVYDPAQGRTRKSYLYRAGKGKKKKLRKVPEWATAGATSRKEYGTAAYDKRRAAIQKRRDAAARRLRDRGDAFTPNKRRKKARKGSAPRLRRLKAYRLARSAGKGKRAAAKAAVKEVPFTDAEKARGATFVGIKAGEKAVARRKKRTKSSKRRAGRRRTKATRRTTTKRGRKAGRRRSRRRMKRNGALAANKKTRRRRKKATRKATRGRRKSSRRRRKAGRRKARTTRRKRRRSLKANPHRGRRMRRNRRRPMRSNRRRTSRKYRRNTGRRYRKNQGLFAKLKTVAKIGLLAMTGFVGHRVATSLAAMGVSRLTANLSPTSMLRTWEKPITGAVLGFIGVVAISKSRRMKDDTKTAIAGGVMVSVMQQVLVAALTAANQPQLLPWVSGVGSSSTAYRLRGTRGMRGMGAMERNATSIMPRYAQVGQYQQAAAGLRGRQMGEYFANPGLQGVGNYEKAGPLAMSAVMSSVGQAPIDDGIRPDSNLEAWMELAESAAGVGAYQQAAAGLGRYGLRGPTMQAVAGRRGRRGTRGMGEYYSARASNGGFTDYSLPTNDQWIPNGPVWAGEMTAGDSPTESEIPAGILQGPGGNGVLSG